MFDISLPLFPLDSSAITITTCVWVGVVVSVFFNLRFGWTLSGLVVPGYLVPLFISRPTTVGVILLEAAITHLIVVAISDWPRRKAYWSSFFGRDRFFVILVVSVIVRVIMDGYLLPYVGRIAVEQYGLNIDYRNNLSSFGLIVVALIANYFWKPGVARGLTAAVDLRRADVLPNPVCAGPLHQFHGRQFPSALRRCDFIAYSEPQVVHDRVDNGLCRVMDEPQIRLGL